MKISVILTSFNRPKWVRQSLKSILDQTYKNYQVIVIDESNLFDMKDVLKEFNLTEVALIKNLVDPRQRAAMNRLSININEGLRHANGDLVCYLADDDYYYPTWFEQAAAFFKEAPSVGAAFGKLVYSNNHEMEFLTDPAPVNLRFFNQIIANPFDKIDHNQAMHRRFTPPLKWPEDLAMVGGPDAYYFRDVAKNFPFYPIQAFAAVKRVHPKNLQSSLKDYYAGAIDGSRES